MEELEILLSAKNLPPMSQEEKTRFADSILSEPAAIKARTRIMWPATIASAATALIVIAYTLGGSRTNTTPAPTTKTYSTTTGQRAKIQLGDGSEVVLNAGTQLQYQTLGNGTREVALDGEALFTVVNSQSAPFIVRTGNATTRVLGTSFSIRNYHTDPSIQVTVATGKVSLGETVLAPGDQGTYTAGKVTVAHNSNIASALAWTDGELVFRSTPLRNALPDLERWYGIKVSVSDKRLLDEPITTSLKTESIPEVINLLASALDATSRRNGMNVTFYPRTTR